MTKKGYMEFHKAACQRLVTITEKKNADYTGGNDDPFANFRQIETLVTIPNIIEIGFVTRMSDKLARIGSFVTKGELKVKEESVEDTLLDLANYCILMAGFLKTRNPTVNESVRDLTCV